MPSPRACPSPSAATSPATPSAPPTPTPRRARPGTRGGAGVVDVWGWSVGELAVPSYPEDRVFRAVARDVCRHAADPADAALVIFGRPGRLRGDPPLTAAGRRPPMNQGPVVGRRR